MRHVLLLTCGLSLAILAMGCKTIQYTAGVCDCDPPPVHTVVQSGYAPAAPAVAATPAIAVMPRADHGR